jgi:glyoxylase-like metal-dependent hydrolase (beta-lactamase superfamily II)
MRMQTIQQCLDISKNSCRNCNHGALKSASVVEPKTPSPSLGLTASQFDQEFDHAFEDGEEFKIGNVNAEILHLPGHTPDHMGYLISSNVCTGDSIFNLVSGQPGATFLVDR